MPVERPDYPRRSKEFVMAFIIAEPCIGTCDTSCVEVCPVDCIIGDKSVDEIKDLQAAGDTEALKGLQLFIDPDICIDCGACLPECPVDAIYTTEKETIEKEGSDESVKKNYEFFNQNWK